MRMFYRLKLRIRLELAILSLLILAFVPVHCPVLAADVGPQKPPASSTQSKPPPEKTKSARQKKTLTGAELYAVHCNRCHPERYASERTAEQWKTILLHMRTRANLPAVQARAILQYLQEDSGK